MPLTNDFKIKNNLNTLGKILSGGVDIATIFSPSNTSWTLSAVNGTFGVAGGDTLSVQGGNGVDVRVATGTDTVRVSGIDATTSVKGVASFHADNFLVTNGVVTVRDGGILNAELAGSITDDKLSTISTALKVSNSATTATSANTANAIVERGAGGEFSSGSITSNNTVQAVTVNATTGFRHNNGATSGNVLRGNGTNFVSSAIQVSDIPTLNQSTSGSAATLTTSRSLWGQNFTGSANVSGSLTGVGNIIGSSVITLSAGSGNNNINLTPSGTGLVTATGNLSASGTVTGNNIDVKNILSVGAVQVRTVGPSNVFLGDGTTGRDAATGLHNFVFGLNAGSALTVGGYNNFFGANAGAANTSGSSNNFLGRYAGTLNNSGSRNNFLGSRAGAANTSGSSNNFLGYNAGLFNTIGGYNNFLGYNTGFRNTLGSNNNFFGNVAGYYNTTGSSNNFLGYHAGFTNVIGSNNTIIGNQADVATNSLSGVIVLGTGAIATQTNQIVLSTANISIRSLSGTEAGPNLFIGDSTTGNNNATGNHNFVFGLNAGSALTIGGSNNFLGVAAGYYNTEGSNNNFLGYEAGFSNTTGGNNNFLGNCAGFRNTTGGSNNFLGLAAGYNNTTGGSNNFLGLAAGLCNTTGGSNNFFGNLAGRNNNTGCNNNFFGNLAGCSNTTGGNNNFLGLCAGRYNTTGCNNNFFGSSAGFYNTAGSSNNFLGANAGCYIGRHGGSNNTFLGLKAGAGTYNDYIPTSVFVSNNFAVGFKAGYKLSGISYASYNCATQNNIFIGYKAGYNSTATYFAGASVYAAVNNNFLGNAAGFSNTTGSFNNFFGLSAGCSNTTGCFNNFLGRSAGYFNTTGSSNNFLGQNAGGCNTTGNFNNFLGQNAGKCNTTGSCNNFLGSGAGHHNRTGSHNIFIGNNADTASAQMSALSGVIVLGAGAVATESHQIVLSTANISFRSIGSTFEIGSPSLTDNLTVYGAVSSTGIVNTDTGFRVSNGATTGNFLRGNGTNFVSSAIQVSDVPTLNQSTSGSAATLTTGRTIAISGDLSYTSPSFNGSTDVTAIGTLATVNGNVGTFTNASVSVNAKGLVTAASSGTAPVTAVTGTSPVVSSGGTTPAISLASGYGDTLNPYASKTQKTFLAAPNAANGVPTFRTISASDVPTLDQNTTGSAATLTTGRSLWGQNFNGSQNITGSLTGVGNIIGSGAITIQTGSTNQDITLSTSGTGEVNITKVDIDGGTIDGTSIGLSVPASGVFTGITVAGNVNISGNLFVSGSATQIDTANLVVQDPIIFLAEGNAADTVDIGFTAAYNHGEPIKRHTGFVRNNIGGKWTLFSNLSTEILSATQIPFDDPSIVIDTLIANVQGTLTGNVSGVAAQAVQLVTGRTISTTGDVTYTSGSFNGTANVTGNASIANDAVTTVKILSSNVTYAKIQNVSATDRILGRSSSGAGVIEEITCTAAGRALLDDADAAAQRTTLGVGTTDSVTFGEVIVNNGTRSVLNDVYNTTVTSTNVATLATFATASYNSTKYTVQIKQGTTRRAALEIIATKDNGTWEGTVYGIIDQGNIFTNVEISVTGSTVDLVFTFNGNANYTVTAYAQAISD